MVGTGGNVEEEKEIQQVWFLYQKTSHSMLFHGVNNLQGYNLCPEFVQMRKKNCLQLVYELYYLV